MIPYVLAIVVTSISLVLFVIAFSIPKIHRQDDFLWSGLGLLYALILWFSAKQMTTTIILGQVVIVTLLSIYFWEIIKLRKIVISSESITELSGFSLISLIGDLLNRFSEFIDILKDKFDTLKKERQTSIKPEIIESEKSGFFGKLLKRNKKEDSSVANDESMDIDESITTENTDIDKSTSEDISNEDTTDPKDSIDIVPDSIEDTVIEIPKITATNIKQEEDEKEKNISSSETSSSEAIDESLEEKNTVSDRSENSEQERQTSIQPEVTESKKPGFFGKLFKRNKKKDSSLASNKLTDLEDSESITKDKTDIHKSTSEDISNEDITDPKDSIDIVPDSTEDTVIETTTTATNIKQEEETNWDDEEKDINNKNIS